MNRREKGLARTGNARVRCGMIQLAWRFLMFQKDSALAQWYRTRTALVLAFDDAEVAVTLHRAWLSRRGRRMGPPPRNFAEATGTGWKDEEVGGERGVGS